MQIKVIRSVFTPTTTMGRMFINDAEYAYTLEDTNRHLNGDCSRKVPGGTCIDAGTYNVVVNMSAHFKRLLPQILDVKCFEGIRIHGGNTDADTLGCILIGEQSNMVDHVGVCKAKVDHIIELIQAATAAGEPVTIEIINQATLT